MGEVRTIAMIASFPPPYGGIANWVNMVEGFAKKNGIDFIEVNTAPVSRGLDGRTLYDRVVRQGVIMLKKKKELEACLKSQDVNAVHIASSGQLATIRDIMMMKTAKRKNIRAVYHLHFGRVPEIAKNNTLEWKLIKKAISIADCTIAIDLKTLEAIQKHVPDAKAQYIPNPFDMEKVSKINSSKIEKKNIISYVGWIVNTKGIEELIEAWGKIKEQYPDYVLNLVGPYKKEYIEQLENSFDLKGIKLLGEKSNLEALKCISESRVFILPSYTEGFPNVVLEAMALHTPVIATKVGAIPEMLADECGIVIEPQNTNAIVDALQFALDNQGAMSRYAKNGFCKLQAEYEMSVVFEQYKKVWLDEQ